MIVCHEDLNTNNNIVHNNKILTSCSMAHIKHYLMLILTINCYIIRVNTQVHVYKTFCDVCNYI